MSRKTLHQLYAEHTGKVSDKWSLYLTEYDRLFDGYRDKPVRLLEIGIQNGGSLDIWSKYFSNAAALVGCDINPDCARLNYDDPRIGVIIGDANAPDVRERVFQRSPQFDIIIDDGSHLSSDIIKTFTLYFPRVVEGGVFIAEDLHCSYWGQFEGGLFDPYSSLSFFKRLADVINHEHWGIPKARADVLRGIFTKYGCEVDEETLSQVHSVEFINSMCVVRKASPAGNGLGCQVIAGLMELVVPGRLQLNGRPFQLESLFDQSSNPWTARVTQPDETIESTDLAVANLNQTVAERDGQIASLNQALSERDGQIASLNQALSERDGQIASLNQVVAERYSVVNQILASTSWRITRPLREIKSFFTSDGGFTSRQETSPKRFDAVWYLKRNPDVAMSCMDPYEHYILFGKAEGRQPAPDAFLLRNIRRARFIYIILLVAIRRGGGIVPTINKVRTILKRGGWNELRGWMIHHCTLHVNNKKPCQAYSSYIEAMEPKQADLERMKGVQASFSYRPKFSIVVPVYNVEEKWLRRFIESVQSQVYPVWELCIADDCSTVPYIGSLLTNYAASDSRIKVVFREKNGHISAATNSAIDMATGDFMCLMDNDDEIAPNALYEFAHLLNQDAQIDMIYSDEDKIDLHNERYEPFFKPDWSPESLEGCMYTAHFACYKMNIVREVGGFRTGYDGAQDYDFVLRFSERAKKIVHVPKILYHWRAIPGSTAATMDAKDYVLGAAVRALTDRANRMSGGGKVKLGRYPGSFDVRYAIHGSPLVSIIIPSAGRCANVRGKSTDLLVSVINTIYEKNTYQNFEIIVVDNGDLRQETIEALSFYNCKFVHFEGEFNIAAKMNMGAKEARGEYLLFMNDDIEAIAHDWMECMLQLAQRPGIGVVGAKLYFENDKLQHVGVAFWNGLPDHIGREMPGTDPGYFFSSCANRNYLAVTGAVMMSKKSVFEEVGGFDERFAINYNDIDFCLKVFQNGHRIVFAAGAELYHYESVSRERTVAECEINLFQNKWMNLVAKDPYFGPYFVNHPPNFMLRNDWLSVPTVDPLKSIVLSLEA